MKSIMHKKDGTCYLCMLLHEDYGTKHTEEHHVIYGAGGRKLSEKYGLKVHLCIEHHRTGKEAVHSERAAREILCKEAQRVFEKHYPGESFLKIFGRNYLEGREPKRMYMLDENAFHSDER